MGPFKSKTADPRMEIATFGFIFDCVTHPKEIAEGTIASGMLLQCVVAILADGFNMG